MMYLLALVSILHTAVEAMGGPALIGGLGQAVLSQYWSTHIKYTQHLRNLT